MRLLIVEDSEDDTMLVVRELRRGGYAPEHERVETSAAMRAALAGSRWDVVISDFYLPTFDAPSALEVLKESGLDLPFIVVTGSIGEDIAVAAMKAGASDYLLKDNLARLVPAVRRELREAESRRQGRALVDRLAQAEKLESLGRLAGGVAHDLSSILTSILGYADLGLGQLPDGHAARDDIQGIRQHVQRAATLTRQLLAVASRQVIEPRVLNLNDAILDSLPTLRPILGGDVELATALAPDLWPVTADPRQIEQVLVCLVTNAQEAIPGGGEITIETRNARLSEGGRDRQPPDVADECAVLAVSDTGVGMTDEVKARAFEPFFSTKPPGEGNGLGLATCYGIVAQNGGHIDVSSAPDLGTTFNVYLPRARQAVEAPLEAEGPGPGAAGTETLLLVEDEESARVVMAQALRRFGYTVVEAADGPAALRIVSEPSDPTIDLLVTDIVMPHMSGKELADRMALTHPSTRVLFISGYPDETIARHGVLGAGITLLQKPFSSAELATAIRRVLDR